MEGLVSAKTLCSKQGPLLIHADRLTIKSTHTSFHEGVN